MQDVFSDFEVIKSILIELLGKDVVPVVGNGYVCVHGGVGVGEELLDGSIDPRICTVRVEEASN